MNEFLLIVGAVVVGLFLFMCCLPLLIAVAVYALSVAYSIIALAWSLVLVVVVTPLILIGRALAWATRPIQPFMLKAFKLIAGLD